MRRRRKRARAVPPDYRSTAVLVIGAVCVSLSLAAGGFYMAMMVQLPAVVAEDDRGGAVTMDELRQVVLHYDDDTWAEYVVHRDDVETVIRAARERQDDLLNGITVYRMRRNWPSDWRRDELRTLLGDGHPPVYEWSLHETTIQLRR